MNEDQATEFLRTHRQTIMATIRKDGRPQLSNVLSVYDDGKLYISITETRAKYHNLVRDPRCTLLVLGDTFWQYLSVDGTVTFERLPEAAARLRWYYETASGQPHPDWAEYDATMAKDRRVLAVVRIERMYPLDR